MLAALSIAGLDPSGGAGVLADIRSFHAAHVHGFGVVTAHTVQSASSVHAVHALAPSTVHAQLDALFAETPPNAIKLGMLGSAAMVEMLAEFLPRWKVPLVIDPVLRSGTGVPLLDELGAQMLHRLFASATLITPNAHEAAELSGLSVQHGEDAERAAKVLHERFGCAVLVKGGHLDDNSGDVCVSRGGVLHLPMERLATGRIHGAGCALSAVIAAELAHGLALGDAIALAHRAVGYAIAQGEMLSGEIVVIDFHALERALP